MRCAVPPEMVEDQRRVLDHLRASGLPSEVHAALGPACGAVPVGRHTLPVLWRQHMVLK